MNIKYIALTTLILQALLGCVKDKIVLDENTIIPGLTPSLAIPIGEASLTLEDVDEIANADELAYNAETGYYEYVLNRKIFHYPSSQLLAIETQNLTTDFSLNQTTSDLLNLGSVGDITPLPPLNMVYDMNLDNGELLDSIIVSEGSLSLNLSCTIKHNLAFDLTIPGLKLNGQPYTTSFVMNYPGSVPFAQTIDIDVSGYTLDLTGNGSQVNTISVAAQITLTHSGQSTTAGDAIIGNMIFDIDKFQSVWGYFGQYTEIIDVDSNDVNFFDDLNGGTLFLSDPRIELSIINTAGLDMDVEFTSIIAPNGGSEISLGGTDLTEIPTIAGATNPGDTSITLHTIDNSGTSPNLSVTLNTDPDYFIYTASGTTNPDGVSENFILDTSYVSCNAKIIIPAFGYADNFTITDSIDADIEQIIKDASSSGSVVTYEDVEEFTLRLVIRNGLPVSAGVKAYFTDSNYVVIDSVFMTNDYQYIIDAGLVDVSLDPSDDQYGRVYQSTESVTDITFTRDQIQHLIDNKATEMIIKAIGFTALSNTQQEIKFFPDDEIWIKVSAKIDFNLDLSK